MDTRNDKTKNETKPWEIFIIALIWLIAISLIYIIFWKIRIAINL